MSKDYEKEYIDLNHKIKMVQECEDINSDLYLDTVKNLENKVRQWNYDYLKYKKHSESIWINIFNPKKPIQNCDTIDFSVEYTIKEIYYDKGKD